MNIADFMQSDGFLKFATAIPAIPAILPTGQVARNSKIAGIAIAKPTNPPNQTDWNSKIAEIAVAESAKAEKSTNNPDRWTWPHSDAWSDGEIVRFTERQARFERQGLPTSEAEELAERLLLRDRDPSDDRRLCLECGHCIAGRCANSRNAGFIRGNAVGDLAVALHRCPGYAAGDGTLAPPAPPRGHSKTLGHPLTDTDKGRAQAYHRHHLACRTCQAAGIGHGQRCADGRALWQSYQNQEVA